jgi:hypothetical protein
VLSTKGFGEGIVAAQAGAVKLSRYSFDSSAQSAFPPAFDIDIPVHREQAIGEKTHAKRNEEVSS